jgi:hypothetical protein
VVLTLLFCEVSTEAPCPLLRIGTSHPEAHHETARLCFLYRPELMFFRWFYFQFNAIKTAILTTKAGRF